MNLGSCEINRISDSKSNGGSSGTSSKKNPHNGTWATIKNKLKGPEKAEKEKRKTKERNEAPMSISKKRGMFELNFGSQVMKQQSVDNYNMMMMEEHARSLLRKDECSAVIRHVKNYHEQKHLDVLIDTLLQILDNSEKLQLLKDIRGVIYPYHVALFDNKVHKYNIKEYERMPTKLHLPLKHDHQRSTKPHKHLMTTVIDVTDEDGHFQIKTMEQHNRDVDHEKAVIKAMRSSLEVETDSEDGGEQTNYNLTRQESAHSSDVGDTIVVYISKQKTHLGLILSGGEGQHPSPVKVETILKNSAAADDGNIKPGMIILAVDDQSLRFKSLNQVLAALKKSYNNKSSVAMKLIFKRSYRF